MFYNTKNLASPYMIYLGENKRKGILMLSTLLIALSAEILLEAYNIYSLLV